MPKPIPFNASLPSVTISTDGACVPNPGLGAWAYTLRFGNAYKEQAGRSPHSTSNRMEMQAVIEGLRALKRPCRVLLRTDSKVVISWCKPSSFSPKCQKRARYPEAWALIQEYRELVAKHTITFQWIRGHAGDIDNERCDFLCRAPCVEA